jgi:hypothetical protein
MWVGYIRRGWLGALGTALAFILPSFVVVLAVAFFYVRYQGLAWVQSLFYGIAPAVIAIIAIAAVKLSRLSNGRDIRLWAISAVTLVVTAVTGAEIALLFVGAGLLIHAVGRSPQVRPGDRLLHPRRHAPGPGRDRRTGNPTGPVSVLPEGRGADLRQRAGDRPLLPRGSGGRAPVAHGGPVPGRSGHGADHAGPSGHHGHIHRISGRWVPRRGYRHRGHLNPDLSGGGGTGTVVHPPPREPASQGVRQRGHRRGGGSHRGCDHRPGPGRHLRPGHHGHRRWRPALTPAEGPRTGAGHLDRRRRPAPRGSVTPHGGIIER